MSIILPLIVTLTVAILGLVVFTARTARKVEAALPPSGRFIEIDGERIHYVDLGGTAPPLVMIHGLGGNLMHFTYALADRLTNEFRVIMVDRPGCGYSERPDGAPADLTAQAATLAKFMREFGLKRPLVVGHSLGGALSLAIALDHPDCVGALALIAPLTHVAEVPDVFKGLFIRSPILRKVIAWTLATPLGILREKETLREVFRPERAPADFMARAGGPLGLRPSAFCSASSDLVLTLSVLPKYVDRYASLALPMGMLFARGDRLLDYRAQAEAMKAICPALDLELMDGGHMLPMTAPDRCAALIRRCAARQQ
jgi:pimeloyl-ACP methyl ester carboxylesterase